MNNFLDDDDCHKCSGEVPNLVKFLVERGANFNCKDSWGHTPLDYAIERNDHCAIKALVAAGLDINSEPLNNNSTTLNFTISKGKLETVCLILNLGADWNKTDRYGRSSIHVAAMEGRVDVMEMLLEKGVELSQRDKRGLTPLHLASWYGCEEAVTWLLDHGVSTEEKDVMGWTPLHYAAEWDRIYIAKLLLSRSANVNSPDVNSHTPLYWSIYCGHSFMAKLLSKWGGVENVFYEGYAFSNVSRF